MSISGGPTAYYWTSIHFKDPGSWKYWKCSCPSMYIMHIQIHMHMHNIMYMYMHYVHTWTRTFFRVSIRKNLNIGYILEFWQSGAIPKKTRAEKCCILVCFARRDLSYETDSGPKTKTVSRVISGVFGLGFRHRLINLFLVININLLCKAFLWCNF